MKIQHITADNFLRLNLFDVDTSQSVVHLFAGSNEAGKSSIQEAIRFALLGETVRLGLKPKKGDYKLMIRDGAKIGTVTVTADGSSISRDIKSGKEESSVDPMQIPEYLPYLLDAQRFAHEPMSKRRAFLIELTQTKVEPDDIARRMEAKGVHVKCTNHVKSLLRGSMDAGYKESVNRASAARAEWKGITGTTYGSQIAKSWAPVIPEGYDPKALLDGEGVLGAIQGDIDKENIKKGGLIAKIDESIKTMAAQGRSATFDQTELDDLIKDRDKYTDDHKILEDSNRRDNATLANARELVPVPCCECGAMLRVSFHGKNVDVEPFKPVDDDKQQELVAIIINRGADISELGAKINGLKQKISELRRLEAISLGGSKKVTHEDIDGLNKQLNDCNTLIGELTVTHTDLDERLVKLRATAEKVRDANGAKDRAQSLYRAVLAWKKCAEALAPDGIPAEILSDTLKPVNDRLRNTSITTGWPQVSIDPTMEIVAEGRRYSLLSESARWRADAAIADAIAYLSSLKLLIIDRLDVLDISNRGALMRWVSTIQEDYDTIFLFGTLKAAPSLPDGMESHWVENGEIKEVE